MNKVKLGEYLEDSVSGFKGMATARTENLDGVVKIELTGRGLVEGEPTDVSAWFREEQLMHIPPPGGFRPAAPSAHCPCCPFRYREG